MDRRAKPEENASHLTLIYIRALGLFVGVPAPCVHCGFFAFLADDTYEHPAWFFDIFAVRHLPRERSWVLYPVGIGGLDALVNRSGHERLRWAEVLWVQISHSLSLQEWQNII